MKQTDPVIKIRLPPEMKYWLKQEAARTRRSQNAFIVWCLDQIRNQAATDRALQG